MTFTFPPFGLSPSHVVPLCVYFPLGVRFQAAKANLEKAQSDLAGTSDEAARAEAQVCVEANEAIVKALE